MTIIQDRLRHHVLHGLHAPSTLRLPGLVVEPDDVLRCLLLFSAPSIVRLRAERTNNAPSPCLCSATPFSSFISIPLLCCCRACQAHDSLRLTNRWSTFSFPLPNSPGTSSVSTTLDLYHLDSTKKAPAPPSARTTSGPLHRLLQPPRWQDYPSLPTSNDLASTATDSYLQPPASTVPATAPTSTLQA